MSQMKIRTEASSAQHPLVSVVMSCFNDEGHVEQSVRSLQRQTLSRWELVAIDDGSTDRTGKLLCKLAEQDSRIRIIHQENSGLTAALILGCREAKADTIARQDADDVSHPERLALQLDLLASSPTLGFVSCFANYVGPAGEFLSTVTRSPDPTQATTELLNERIGPPAHGTVMFRRSVYEQVGGYRLPFYYAQDADLWLRMAEVSEIGYVPSPLYDFRWHPGSITGSGRSLQREFGILGQRCRQARCMGGDESPLLEEVEGVRKLAIAARNERQRRTSNQTSMNYQIGSQLVRNGDIRARGYLKKVLAASPLHVRAWIRLLQSWLSGKKQIASSEGSSL